MLPDSGTPDAGQVAAKLIESIRKFRRVVRRDEGGDKTLGQEYIEMVQPS